MSEKLLEVSDLDAFYGRAHVLHGVGLSVGDEPVGVIGRNGMGKSTLCQALMGLVPRISGEIRFRGENLAGRKPYRIASAGLGYVPQGRRVFPSLTTEEHLRMVFREGDGRWSIGDVYELFPRLKERRKIGGARLSGGEQQMLAIARALLANPALLILDEPSEGLAPTVVERLVETIRKLSAEGVGILLVEQNLSVAAAVADRLLVMVNGRIAHETTSHALLSDEGAQQRYLGVEPLDEVAGGDREER
ncbi:MAG: ABC transporter ATP-binding protein [Actinomycetota bacterium]